MRTPLAIGLASWLAACGDERVAGGGGIETNNTIALRVVDDQGAPVVAARVVARPADWIPGGSESTPPGFELSTDIEGRVSGELNSGRWTFEARKGGLAILSTRDVDGLSGSATLELAKMARLSGRVGLAPGESFAVVSVSGTGHAARTDSNGHWTLDSLPSGTLSLVVSGRESHRDTVVLATGATDTVSWTGSPALRALDSSGWVLLDDFSTTRPAVSIAATGAAWYMSNDRISSGNSKFLRVDGRPDSSWERFLVPGDPAGSWSFQARLDIDTETQAVGLGYLQVGMSLPEPGQCLDFGTLDSLGVSLRGNGTVRLEFRSAIHDSLQDHSSYPGIELTPVADSWTTFRIPVVRIVPGSMSNHPNIPWSRAAECVLEIRVVARMDQDLGMSDLRVHGVPLENFLYPRVRKP